MVSKKRKQINNTDDFHNFLRLHHFLELYSSKEEYEQIIKSYLKILDLAKARKPLVLNGFENENS